MTERKMKTFALVTQTYLAHSDAPSHADQLMTMMQQQQAQLQKVLDVDGLELRQDTKLAEHELLTLWWETKTCGHSHIIRTYT